MPHYTTLDVDTPLIRSVCQYCGRPIKRSGSRIQGCGDVCRLKHRNAKYRVIKLEDKNGDIQFSGFAQDPIHDK